MRYYVKSFENNMRCGVMALCFGLSVVTSDAAYVLLSNGSRVDGSDIRAKSDGEVILTTAQGQRSFFRGQYTKAVADKPADFDKAKSLAAAKKYDEALTLLNDIAQRYRFLEWDNMARASMAQVYAEKGDHKTAADTFEQIFRSSPDAKNNPQIQWPYRQALLAAQQYDKLGLVLDEAIAKGSRADAAKAQVMRGDIKLAQGQIEGAVLDYLRTVILFEAEKEVQPEALYKAGQGLEKLRDARAKEMYKKLKTEYPSSEFAAKAPAG